MGHQIAQTFVRKPRRGDEYVSAYPSMEEVEKASRTQLGSWSRYLPSPGTAAIGTPKFGDMLASESATMDLILKRFKELGGWSPRVSKAVDRNAGN